MKGRIVGDTQCKAIQLVLLAVIIQIGKMHANLLFTSNGYLLGSGNIETAAPPSTLADGRKSNGPGS